ncbi:hypothetical protein BN1195_03601 [Chryseobacterium oranimense G311]|uniref:tape measure protein n=1 Tax=Chryseobacterium oranimense TaxID=421058 RepID=UPI000533A640|nr:tape measure protein [Chryseobacterium oranimense]CEJ71256.1 hypothetical protein BN1195_03601 [Chryseobacterium oranimense G311]DAG72825.1 MAG TPA: tail tape measure [Caudoviricetes sp.]
MSDKLAVIQGQKTVDELKKIEAEGRRVVSMFRDMVTQANAINRSLNTGRLREFNSALQELNRTTQQHATLERQLAAALERTARLEHQQAQLATEQARTRRELAAAAREESRARQQAAREAANEARQNRDSSSAHSQLTRETRQARQTARDYGAEMIQLRNKLRQGTISQREYRQQMADLARNFRSSTQEAIRLERELRRLNQQTLPSGQRNGALQGRVTDILKGLGIAASIDNIASSFYKLGTSFKDTAVKLETLRLAQKSIFKTNEEVARQNLFLTDISQKYGVELISLSQAYNNFSASAQGTTLEGEKSKTIFDAVAKSSAMLGVNAEDTNGILRALGQMMSKGKVQAEELRGQLGDRMAGAFRLFADGMGVTTAQLDKMLKDGEVLAEDVLPKFADQLNKKYKLGIGEEIETSQASITRLTNAWTIFVDAVENRTNVVGSSISSLTSFIAGMLKELTPSETITNIQKEQLEFNKLGIILRQNFGDVKRRKEIIDQMIALNPFWLDGLDKEKVTLEQISDRLRQSNEQYVQKIILQKYENEINEVLEEQAERIGIIAKAYAEYSTSINNLTTEQQKVIQSFTDGTITYEQAYQAMKKLGGDWKKSTTVLWAMRGAVEENTITSKGFIGTMKHLNAEGTELTNKYNQQIGILNKLTQSNGNLLGINTSMIKSNYMLGGSYDFLSQKQDLAAKKLNQDYQKAIKGAREAKQAYTAFNGFFFDANTAKNTGKKVGEWDIVDNKLVKRVSATIPKEPKKYTGAKLDGYQKDFIMNAQGERDSELANLEKDRLDLKIGYEEYLKKKLSIAVEYSNKIQNYLKGSNAKERQVEGAARKKAVDAAVQVNKEIYDQRSKDLEENFKKEQNISERAITALDQNKDLTDVERLNKQIAVDSEMIAQLDAYYAKQIELARNSAESVIEWERKRDEEIGKIEDNRLNRIASIPEAINTEIENQAALAQSNKEISYEKQRQLIVSNKKLNAEERSYQLSVLEKQNAIDVNKLEIERNNRLKGEILARLEVQKLNFGLGVPTPEEIKKLAEYESIIQKLTGENIQNQKDLDLLNFDKIAQGMQPVVDLVSNGLNDLGLNHVADQFTKMYQKIIDEGKDFSMSTKEIFQAAGAVISDFSQIFINKQKERNIAALDEQLSHSKDVADQESEFINGRLEQLNALEDLTVEQMDERSRLEAEAMVVKEQQRQREKMIETQKAKAEQKAAAQQALINGALAATMTLAQMGFIAGAIPAALALAFGIAQSVSIMSKDPTPKYWKGRKGGPAERAITQDRGREIITGQDGKIKSLGSDTGSKVTWLEAGDTVYTADETKRILKTMGTSAQIGQKVIKRAVNQSLQVPVFNVSVQNNNDNKKLETAVRKALKDFAPTSIRKENGKIIKERPGYVSKVVGTYDLKTGEETWI